jgi:hypothetical protein
MSTTINYDYYNTLTTKVGSNDYTFRGKTNAPNLNIVSGSHTQSYVASDISIRDDKLTIRHIPSTNSEDKVSVIFTLYTDTDANANDIDKLIALKPGEKLEIDLNKLLKSVSQKHTIQTDKNGKTMSISYDEPITIHTKIKKKEKGAVIEGLSCSDPNFDSQFKGLQDQMGTLAGQMATAMTHINNEPAATWHHDKDGTGGNGSKVGAVQDMDCTAFPDGKATDDQIKLVSLPISANLTESQANSKLMVIFLAYGILLTIMFASLFFFVPLVYTFILTRLIGADNVLQPGNLLPLVEMHHVEGLVSFIFIISSVLSYALGGDVGVTAGSSLISIWMMSALIISTRKEKWIKSVSGDNAEKVLEGYYGKKNPTDPKNHIFSIYGCPPNSGIKAIMYYMFFFLPAYPMAWVLENINRLLKKKDGAFAVEIGKTTILTPAPFRVWNTYT